MTSIKSTDKDYTGEHYEDDFSCSYNNLKSLEGAPVIVGGYFSCTRNYLKSLEGAPVIVGGSFYCTNNNLESLEGAPKIVGGDFNCYNNKLKSLEGAPVSVSGYFDCEEDLLNGENLYIITNALLNGRRGRPNFEEMVLEALTEYFK